MEQTNNLKSEQATILVVEDDGELRSMLRRSLRERGYRVVTAEDADEAFERVECDKCKIPVLILTDLQLPMLDAVLESFAQHPVLRDVQVATIDPDYADRHYERIKVLEDYDQLEELILQS